MDQWTNWKKIGLSDLRHCEELPDMRRYYLYDQRTVSVPYVKRKAILNPAGSYALTLDQLCDFAKFTLTNSARLPETIYTQMITRANDKIRSDTSASWHMASKGYLFHDGGLPGIFCNMRVDRKARQAFMWGTNSNVNPESTISSVGQYTDIKNDILRLLGNC